MKEVHAAPVRDSSHENIVNAPVKPHRYEFIDYIRGLAVVMMIATHVMNGFLAQEYKEGWIYGFASLMGGFPSTTFIFCAGAGFWIAAERRFLAYKQFQKPLWLYVRRLLFILGIAYWMHIPAFSMEKIFSLTYEEQKRFFEADVLHTISAASFLALGLLLVSPGFRFLQRAFWTLGLAIFAATPVIWTLEPFNFLPVWLAPYIVRQPFSKFPLFPWSGYFFIGAALTSFFMSREDKVFWAKRIFFIAAAVCVISLIQEKLPLPPYGWNDWWYSSPFHALFRVSVVVMSFCAFFLIEGRIRAWKRLAEFLQRCGQESLFIYVVHLMIVYGSLLNFGLFTFINGKSGPWKVIVLSGVITLGTYQLAMMWQRYKLQDEVRARRLIIALAIMFFTSILFVPKSSIG